MKHPKLTDELLTRYLLDELMLREREAVEKALEKKPDAKQRMQDLGDTIAIAKLSLQTRAETLTPTQQNEIIQNAYQAADSGAAHSPKSWQRPVATSLAAVLIAGVGIYFSFDYFLIAPREAALLASEERLRDYEMTLQRLSHRPNPMTAEQIEAARLLESVTVNGASSGGGGLSLSERSLASGSTNSQGAGFRGGGGGFGGGGGQLAGGLGGGLGGGGPTALAGSPQALAGTQPFTQDPSKVYWPGHNTEQYDNIKDNVFRDVRDHPLSTFSIDVDTASYSNVRRFLQENTIPPKDAVRIEEMINYFDYQYEPPRVRETPFAAHVEIASAPWKTDHRLVRIGLKGWELEMDERPPSNLVFLLDVSGSMRPANKLPLVKEAMGLLAQQLRPEDRIAIAVYAGASGLVLPSTPGNQQRAIHDALDRLQAGGSTNGGAGIQLAYDIATQNFIEGGVNRVILCTDGDFNVGVTNRGDLVRLVEDQAKSGVFLTVLGFGMGNIKDATLEQLADKGNGNYAYIDSAREARKVLVEQASGTLVTIAKDVKIQVEFNPAEVAAYRLIGYENRLLAPEDFNDDTKDAGEIGAGHTVTALYEVVPAGGTVPGQSVDPLKYQTEPNLSPASNSGELLTLKLRYKAPDGDTSKLLEFPAPNSENAFRLASTDYKFAAAVAGFGMVLRDSPHRGDTTLEHVLAWARDGKGADRHGYRGEFEALVRKAAQLIGPQAPAESTSALPTVLDIQAQPNGTRMARIRTQTLTKWLPEGERIERFELLSVDTAAQTCDVYDIHTGRKYRLFINGQTTPLGGAHPRSESEALGYLN